MLTMMKTTRCSQMIPIITTLTIMIMMAVLRQWFTVQSWQEEEERLAT